MKLLKKLMKNIAVATKRVLGGIRKDLAEIYTMFVLFIAIPGVLWTFTDIRWGLLLSFVLQAVVGVLYIRGKA